VTFIDRNTDRPFFLYLPYNAIHSPMQARVDDVRRFQPAISDEQRRVFGAMLAPLDEGVGAVLDRLRRRRRPRSTASTSFRSSRRVSQPGARSTGASA
jgi:arylsulfatase A-like enzyme